MQYESELPAVDGLQKAALLPDDADAFLDLLAKPGRPPITDGDVVVAVAHPDDESIGCGAQLARIENLAVVVVTDGAPRPRGGSVVRRPELPETYATIRRQELVTALALAGIPEAWLIRFGVADQQAALHLVEITHRLNALFARRATRFVLTHAYEGGHPDHDAVAFAVHAAVRLRRLRGHSISIVEMPYYSESPSGPIVQRFSSDAGRSEITLHLNEHERTVKRRMFAAHQSQQRTLAQFAQDIERFRRASHYDFTRLPSSGNLFYEKQDWGMTGARWLELADDALKQLALDGAA